MHSLKIIVSFLVFLLFIHIFASIAHLYWLIDWVDMPMHFLGGFWVAMVFFYLNQKFFKIQNFWTTVIMTLSFVALIGVFWEFFEFLYDFFIFSKEYFGVFQRGISDTMSDLFFDLIGGSAFLIVDKILRGSILDDVNRRQQAL